MGLNDDVDQEFGTGDRTAVIDTPKHNEPSDNNVKDEAIFTKGIEFNRLPELDAVFVIQKSKEDRLVELAEKSLEIEESGGISRNDVIAVESIIEDYGDSLPPESSKEEDLPNDGDSPALPAETEPTLGNPNLYTEEKSKTEYEPTLQLLKSKYDTLYSDLKGSTIDVANKVIECSSSEIEEKRLAYVAINTQFNKNIVKFLTEFESDDLESVKCIITRSIKWNDLMSIPLHYLRKKDLTYEEDKKRAANVLDQIADTKSGQFVEELSKLFSSETISRTMTNFAYGELNKLISEDTVYRIDKETGELTVYKIESDTVSSDSCFSVYTIGALFGFIGSERLSKAINSRIKAYDWSRQCVKDTLEKIKTLEQENGDKSLKDNLDTLLEYSGCINTAKSNMIALLTEIGSVFKVYEVINKYMLTMCAE